MDTLILHDHETWSISNFWDNKTCSDIIDDLESSGLFPASKLSISTPLNLDDNLDTRNKNRILYNSQTLAAEIWDTLFPVLTANRILPNAIGINSEFRFYKYGIGDEFLPHKDGCTIINETEKSKHSLLIYLNDNFRGGTTIFPNCSIHPETGKAVFFLHDYIHSSTIITEDIKYILRTDIISKI